MKSHLFTKLVLASAIMAILFLAAAPVFADKSEDQRIAEINKRNAELGYQWTAGKTSVSGLSAEEKQKLLGLLPMPEGWGKNQAPLTAPGGATFATSFDWRDHNGVTPVTNQRSCGSCWAFAAVAQLEAHTLIYDLRQEDLSEQQVIDCNSYGAGCGGGWLFAAYELFISPGCVGEACYPYEAKDNPTCKTGSCPVISKIASYTPVSNNVNAIKAALATGPVATGFTVIDDYYNYTSGCYQSQSTANQNHAMIIIGWDDNQCSGQGAWIVKNSWGPGWGQGGFAYIKYGSCNIGANAYQITYLPSTILVHLTSPVGGESWNVGSQHAITWSVQRQTPDSLSILLSLDSGVTYAYTIAHGMAAGVTSYNWTVPELPVNTARIKVLAYYSNRVGGYDMSDTDFAIKGKPYRYVSKTGGNVFPYSMKAWAATTIQTAVNAGVPGDTIMVAADTYHEAVTVSGPVYILGGWNGTFTVRAPKTYVTKLQSAGSLVSFMNVSSGVCGVEGCTLKKGSGTSTPIPNNGVYGGGILSYQSSPIIKGNVIDSCGVATVLDFSGGGAIACYGGSPIIDGNTITAGTAQCGGGIYLYQASATIKNNHIIGCYPNAEYNGTKNGGGVYALHASAAFERNRIENNDGYKKGAGVYLYLSPASFERDTITLNDSGDMGAGICADRSALAMSHSLVRGNTSPGMGGGIYQRAGNVVITNSAVVQNRAAIIGGGVYADSCWGGVTNNTFDRNRSGYGGGNVYVGSSPSLNVRNNLVTFGGKNGFQAASMSNVTFRFNNCFGNTPLDVATSPAVDTTNTSRNPLYADTTSYDYHLRVNSGGIDTGDPAGPADPDGSRADQGAFGGPAAFKAAPDYVRNLTATAANDTTISLGWDGLLSGATSYVVYGSPTNNFLPGASVYLGSVSVPGVAYLHHPVTGCRYYRVSAANAAGYGGGYSNQASACASGPDLIPPTVTVIYPNGHEILEVGDTIRIDWHATDNRRVDSVSVYYSENAGRAYTRIAHGWRPDSTYAWIVPSALSDSCLVKVVAYDPGRLTGFDTSDSLFSIKARTGVHDKGNGDNGGTPRYVTALEQNFPNPFNGTTTIHYSIADRCEVEIRIYDPAGRVVRVLEHTDRSSGRYSVLWNGKDGAGRGVASGMYFCRIKAGKFSQTRKILYVR